MRSELHPNRPALPYVRSKLHLVRSEFSLKTIGEFFHQFLSVKSAPISVDLRPNAYAAEVDLPSHAYAAERIYPLMHMQPSDYDSHAYGAEVPLRPKLHSAEVNLRA